MGFEVIANTLYRVECVCVTRALGFHLWILLFRLRFGLMSIVRFALKSIEITWMCFTPLIGFGSKLISPPIGDISTPCRFPAQLGLIWGRTTKIQVFKKSRYKSVKTYRKSVFFLRFQASVFEPRGFVDRSVTYTLHTSLRYKTALWCGSWRYTGCGSRW